jgi:hypothetical protein
MLRAEARGGLNGNRGWTADGEAAVGVKLHRVLAVEAGVRGMGVSRLSSTEPLYGAFGPTLGARVAF